MECNDYVKAMKEMQGKYVGNRPIKLLPSKWTDKSLEGGFGVIKQANNQSTLDGRKQITEFESTSGTYLTEKYAHLIGAEAKAKIDKILMKRQRIE